MISSILAVAMLIAAGCSDVPAQETRAQLVPTPNAAPGRVPPGAIEEVERTARAIVDAGLTPGLSVAIAAGDSVEQEFVRVR